MRVVSDALQSHLNSGATTLCRCWLLERRSGLKQGFTDHDRDLKFDGELFKASSGLDAAAIQQTTGLSVDNTQAVGALSDLSLREEDILAGFYDGAKVTVWLVNWENVGQNIVQFRGELGEIQRGAVHFEAELRGITESLNLPQGRAFHRNCNAVLGDKRCKFDLSQSGYTTELSVEGFENNRIFTFSSLPGFAEAWFEQGTIRVLSGTSTGHVATISRDWFDANVRKIELWQEILGGVAVGDQVRLEAGCAKTVDACALKFLNFENFRGFPHIPGEDWALSYPVTGGVNSGSSFFQ